MTILELSRLCDATEMLGLTQMVVAIPRKKGGCPKRIDRTLPCLSAGGSRHDYHVWVSVADARRYILRHSGNPERVIAARVRTAAEKLSHDLRARLGVPDPPENPWLAPTPELRQEEGS